MRLIDIGVNLANRQFQRDLDDVLARARAAGVERFVITGTSLDVSRSARALAGRLDGAWSTAGVHPHDAAGWNVDVAAEIAELGLSEQVVAIGECGLDFWRNYSEPAQQRVAFEAQLELAASTGLPLFLHQRDAHDEFLSMLKNAWPSLTGGAVVHCFTEGPRIAADYLELGCSLGVTGWVCDERRGGDLRDSVPMIPADRLLIETDAPYLMPRTITPKPEGRRNEPMHLAWVLREVAALRGEAAEVTAEAAWSASSAAFGLSD